MTPSQIEIVNKTWRQVLALGDEVAKLFYDRLFEIDPAVRPLFTADNMPEQRKKLMLMLGAAVAGLEDLHALVPVLQDLGRRHVGYGVTEDHYDSVGAALLWTLERGLGEAWNEDVSEAWAAVYALVAEVMIDAARDAAA
ncbi:globin family protein [Pelagibius sp.]|uniref:globin family protein n=1 Tax=Pelagibius sp. TaxID=1931238 RepID=UPI003BB1B41B